MTNLEYLRQMNSEELTEFLYDLDCCEHCYYNGNKCINTEGNCNCIDGVKAWLEQEITPTLTDDEKVILRNLKGCERIHREANGDIFIVNLDEKYHGRFPMFNHLFKFIKKGTGYEISKLLGE